ncbi:MAG TPA: YadA C-terminal domain-containing protein [Pseudoxanthomonas sp.]|nr:YadA C-terminal domain-containing protein [Pseudoxanthomonas sp.]
MAGATGPQGPQGEPGVVDPDQVAAIANAGDAATLEDAHAYTDRSASQTLSSANSYTDLRLAALAGLSDTFQDLRDDVNQRFSEQDRRIDRQGAMGSAMLSMAINAGGTASERGRVAVGVGFQNGESALSVGYGKRIGKSASFSLGGAFSGSEKSAGMGFGFDL